MTMHPPLKSTLVSEDDERKRLEHLAAIERELAILRQGECAACRETRSQVALAVLELESMGNVVRDLAERLRAAVT